MNKSMTTDPAGRVALDTSELEAFLDQFSEKMRQTRSDLASMREQRDAARNSHAAQQRNTLAFYHELNEANAEIERLRVVLQAMVDEGFAETEYEMRPQRWLELHNQAMAALAPAEGEKG